MKSIQMCGKLLQAKSYNIFCEYILFDKQADQQVDLNCYTDVW